MRQSRRGGFREVNGMRRVLLVAVLGCLSATTVSAGDLAPRCLMAPVHPAMRLPGRGLTWLPGEDNVGRCSDVPRKAWLRKSSGAVDLFVQVDGPEGSGRYWQVIIGLGERRDAKPIRGICLTTSTMGWRTLLRYQKGALPWMHDLDGDGKAEVILWNSFPLYQGASPAEYGLVAWVYRLASKDSLVVDWDLSRRMARSLAAEYRTSLDAGTSYLGPLRTEAAEALESFADNRCRVLHPNP